MLDPQTFLIWALVISGIGSAIITTVVCYFIIPWVHKRWDVEDSKVNNRRTD